LLPETLNCMQPQLIHWLNLLCDYLGIIWISGSALSGGGGGGGSGGGRQINLFLWWACTPSRIICRSHLHNRHCRWRKWSPLLIDSSVMLRSKGKVWDSVTNSYAGGSGRGRQINLFLRWACTPSRIICRSDLHNRGEAWHCRWRKWSPLLIDSSVILGSKG